MQKPSSPLVKHEVITEVFRYRFKQIQNHNIRIIDHNEWWVRLRIQHIDKPERWRFKANSRACLWKGDLCKQLRDWPTWSLLAFPWSTCGWCADKFHQTSQSQPFSYILSLSYQGLQRWDRSTEITISNWKTDQLKSETWLMAPTIAYLICERREWLLLVGGSAHKQVAVDSWIEGEKLGSVSTKLRFNDRWTTFFFCHI
jgi:hypothetical protein